jgi:hypothetical protein
MKDIEARVSELEEKLINISSQLNIEKARNEIYREIISNNTSIILTGSGLKVTPPTIVKVQPVKLKSPQIKVAKLQTPTDIPPLSLDEDTDIIERFRSSKTIQNKNIIELKKIRKAMFMTMSLTKYIDMCKEQVSILTEIFAEKGFSEKRL